MDLADVSPASPLQIGRALKRWRRINNVKQNTVAEAIGVSQTTISRCEYGLAHLTERERALLCRLIGARPGSASDKAILDLVTQASAPMHLICDLSHRLLAASKARLATWHKDFAELRGTSLWPYASSQIVQAEGKLDELGWYESPGSEIAFRTEYHSCPTLSIDTGILVWTRLPLSDGTFARLVRNRSDAPE